MDAIFKKPGVSQSRQTTGKTLRWFKWNQWNHMTWIKYLWGENCDQKCMTPSHTTELWNTVNLAGISVTKLVEREQSLKGSNMSKAIQTKQERHWKYKAHGKDGKSMQNWQIIKGMPVAWPGFSWPFDILGTLRYFESDGVGSTVSSLSEPWPSASIDLKIMLRLDLTSLKLFQRQLYIVITSMMVREW